MAQCATEPWVVGDERLFLKMSDDVFEFMARTNLQFAIDAVKVTFDSPDTDLQLTCDLHVALVLCSQIRDFLLTLGQSRPQ